MRGAFGGWSDLGTGLDWSSEAVWLPSFVVFECIYFPQAPLFLDQASTETEKTMMLLQILGEIWQTRIYRQIHQIHSQLSFL